MSIKRSGRVLVATLVAASLGATPALATVGHIDQRTPDAKDAAAKAAIVVDKRSPDVIDAATGGAKDLRVTSSLAGPPPAGTKPIVVVKPAPVPAPASDGFDFASAVIGAAGAAFVAAAMAGGIAVSRRRRIAAAA